MIHHPTEKYCGLTIILDKPSRHDSKRLISGLVGDTFDSFLLPFRREQCLISTLDSYQTAPPETKIILALGDGCKAAFGAVGSLNELRGNPYQRYGGVTVIHSYAPQDAFDRRDYSADEDIITEDDGDPKGHAPTKRRNWRWWMMNDIFKAKRYLQDRVPFFGLISPPCINENIEGIIHLLNNVNIFDNLFLDIETTFNQQLTCIGFRINNGPVHVVPWRRYNNIINYDENLCRRFLQALTYAFSKVIVICHNASFDLLVLCRKYRIPLPKRIADTMLMWHRCYPEIEKSLGHLISYFLYKSYHKSEGVFHPKSLAQDQQLWDYNAKDVIRMSEFYPLLIEECKKCDAYPSAIKACELVRPYLITSMTGLKVDKEKFVARATKLESQYEQILRVIRLLVKKPAFNPRSWQQVGTYLYRDMRFQCPDEKNPTNTKTLLKVLLKHELPSLKLILAGRKIAKMASGMKFRLMPRMVDGEETWRATCVYNIAGTDTFRLGSRAMFKYKSSPSENDKKGIGTNMQNWDKAQRDLIIADKGKILAQTDQSGAEALIVAYLCRKGLYRDLFIHGIKPHVFVALHVFRQEWVKQFKSNANISIGDICKMSPEELRNHPPFKDVEMLIKDTDNWPAKERYYFIAKMICHASNYGMKAPTFQTNVLEKSEGAVVLSIKECKEFLELYHGLFPEIREWHLDIQEELKNNRILKNLFGEPRRFIEPWGDGLFKQGYAFKPQSTVGQITNRAVEMLQKWRENGQPYSHEGFDILQNGHDSILYQLLDNEVSKNYIIPNVESVMTPELVSPRGEKFRMKCETNMGYNWAPYKKGFNELGLR